MNKNRICLLIPSLNAGGMERVMSELATYFCRQPELEVHLVMYGISPTLFYQLPDDIIIHTPPFRFDNKKRALFSIKTLFFLRKTIKAIKPYSVLSFGEYWNSFVLLALFGLKLKVYVSDRCKPDKDLGQLHNLLRKLLYPRAKGVIVQTQKAREIYERIIPKARLTMIGNPIRKININSVQQKENIVLSVGRLIHSKHYDLLIKIFAGINLRGWKLIIVGGDAIRQQNMATLQNLVNELNMTDKILLTGVRDDVDVFYGKSNIFAFTSSSEGFPNVIGEAMSAGLPVVAFDCIAGPSEMIEDNINGFLVQLFDDELFRKRLKLLMEDEKIRQRMSIEARKSVEKFAVDSVGQQYLDFILS